jgi:hypothetical protein
LKKIHEARAAANKSYLHWLGMYKYKVLTSLLRLVTVDKYVFKSQPQQIAKRYGQVEKIEIHIFG